MLSEPKTLPEGKVVSKGRIPQKKAIYLCSFALVEWQSASVFLIVSCRKVWIMLSKLDKHSLYCLFRQPKKAAFLTLPGHQQLGNDSFCEKQMKNDVSGGR